MDLFMNILKNTLLIFSILTFSHAAVASYNAGNKLEKCMTQECVNMFKNYKRYARHAMPIATEVLGNFYLHGYGVEQNFIKALRYYEHTANYGSATAQYIAGFMYILGMGKLDIEKGMRWLRWSFKNDNNEAAYYLGVLYLKGEKIDKDLHKAKSWLEKASNKGHAQSQFVLGQMYETGMLGAEQLSKAIDLYSQSSFENAGARERLTALNVALPEPKAEDDGIEHIEVNPLPFTEMLELKLAGLKNHSTPTSRALAGHIEVSCRNAKINCGKVGIVNSPFALRTFLGR